MKSYKAALLTGAFFLASIRMFGQARAPQAAYVVDSIPVVNDPENGDDVLAEDVSEMVLVKNKDSLKLLGYAQFDMVYYVFTKAYRARPDSLKIIPSTKAMQNKEGVWFFHGTLTPEGSSIIITVAENRQRGGC